MRLDSPGTQRSLDDGLLLLLELQHQCQQYVWTIYCALGAQHHLMMHSASGTNMPIMGAEQPSCGSRYHQMVYFSATATKLYLSLATCVNLGLIPIHAGISPSARQCHLREQARRQGKPWDHTSRIRRTS